MATQQRMAWLCVMVACCAPTSTRHAHASSAEAAVSTVAAHFERRCVPVMESFVSPSTIPSPRSKALSSFVALPGCGRTADRGPDQTVPAVSKTPEPRSVCRTRLWDLRPARGGTRGLRRGRWQADDLFGRARLTLQQQGSDGLGEQRQPRLGARRPPGTRDSPGPAASAAFVSTPMPGAVSKLALQTLRKVLELSVLALTLLIGALQTVALFLFNVVGYYTRRVRRPLASYIASWIVHKVLVAVCEDVQGLEVRVDAETSLALLRGEVTGVTIVASKVRLLDVSVADVGIFTDDVRFVQNSINGTLTERLWHALKETAGAINSRSDASVQTLPDAAPQGSAPTAVPAAPGASANSSNNSNNINNKGSLAEARTANATGPSAEGVQQMEEMISVGMSGGERGGGGANKMSGGLTVAEPFAASLVASLTEQDVNTSPPIMYILRELLTFLVRFGLSVGARKTLGEKFGDANSFNSQICGVHVCLG